MISRKTFVSRNFSSVIQPITQLSMDEQQIKDMVERFSADVIAPKVREMETNEKFDDDMIQQLFDNGLMGVEIPEEFGGSGLNFMSSCLVVEEIAKKDPAVAVMVDIQNTLINNMFKFWASDDLKERYCPKLATEMIGSFCLSEPHSGSDAFALSTRADLSSDQSYYTINGNKMWISNAEQAGVFLVFANVDSSKGYKGITCFVIDRDAPGLEIGMAEDKLGIKASSTCPLIFTDCKVPVENVLGTVGEGYKYAIEILNEGRIGIGAQQIGLAQGVFDDTVPYLIERKQFNTPIGEFQGMEHQYAQAATEIECARLLVYNAARLKESGLPFVKEAAMAKLYSSQIAEKTASKCIEWIGGAGFTTAYLAEKYFRDSKIGSIYEGTSNIQLSTIARLIRQEFK